MPLLRAGVRLAGNRMISEAVLLVRGGPSEGQTIPIGKGMVILGRSALNDLVLDEPGVSRQHAGIRGDAEGFWIADLGSRNGTFVNGERIGEEPRRLRNMDRIELGGTDARSHWVFMQSQATIEMPRPPQT